jgi:hypothetical protein
LEGYRIFVTAACAAAAASAGLAPSCAKCCFWCGLGKMATRWQRHRPSQRWLLRRWLRWLCGGGCGSWWLRWWLRRGWLRRWLRWWPRLADAPPPRQGRHLVVTTGCKWSGSERLSVAVGKRGGEGSRHSPPARGEVYRHGSGRRPAPAVPVHGHRGTGGAAVHHGAGLRPAPAVPVQASGLLLHAGARCAPAPCVLWSATPCEGVAKWRPEAPVAVLGSFRVTIPPVAPTAGCAGHSRTLGSLPQCMHGTPRNLAGRCE